MMLIHAKRSGHRINGFLYLFVFFSFPENKYHTTAKLKKTQAIVIQIGLFDFAVVVVRWCYRWLQSDVVRGMSAILTASCTYKVKSNPNDIQFLFFFFAIFCY